MVFRFTNNATNNTYLLNQTLVDFSSADRWCNDNGGHLAAWRSVAEQTQVESYYVGKGWLLPTYHKNYWLGLRSNTTVWPRFGWTEPGLPPPTGATYIHWGRIEPGAITEPNNMTGFEFCGVGNYSQTYGNAWGWADANCSMRAAFICKVRPPLVAPAYTAASRNTFFLNTSEVSFNDAQIACRANGGQLAAFRDIKEQAEVELWYSRGTWLLPKYHETYWMGYNTAKGWPTFAPVDSTVKSSYAHWGGCLLRPRQNVHHACQQ
jgi:hypothetical protein